MISASSEKFEQKLESAQLTASSIKKGCKNLKVIYQEAKDDCPYVHMYNIGGDKYIGDKELEKWMISKSVCDELMMVRCSLAKHKKRVEIELAVNDSYVNPGNTKQWKKQEKAVRTCIETWRRVFIEMSSEPFYTLFETTLSNLNRMYLDGNKKLKYSRGDWQKFLKKYKVNPKQVMRFTPVSAYIEDLIKSKKEPSFGEFWFGLTKVYELTGADVRGFIKNYATPEGYMEYYGDTSTMFAKKKPTKLEDIVAVRAPTGEGAF